MAAPAGATPETSEAAPADAAVTDAQTPVDAAALPEPASSSHASAAIQTDGNAPANSSVIAADEIKEAVGAKNEAAGGIINSLDSMQIGIGNFHISMLDVLVVLLVIAATCLAAWLLTRIARGAIERMKGLDPSQKLLSEKLVSMAIWTLAVLFGIDMLGIDLTALAVFSGAFGLAIGFGLQKTFGNLIAGIILLMDRSIKPGDVIAIADQAGKTTFGQIRKIGIRAVSVTTRDEREYLIPNENLMINQVENWSYSSRNVRIQVPVGVSYN
ncbi:MAG: mechanosensitive ion channel family protein, partial [Sphingomonadaceae bacterium]